MPDEWDWPESLDALAAAPGFHTLLHEDDDVRVLDTRIGPGETTPVHTHCWAGVLYVIASDHFVRRDGEGKILLDTREAGLPLVPGTAVPAPALPPHSLENVGSTEIRTLNIELKHR